MASQKGTDRLGWFREARLGVFFHWSIFSVDDPLAHCLWWSDFNDYKRLADKFKPKKCWAQEWMDLVKKSGAKYAVLTTKHHNGFCLFETETTDFSAPSYTGRDLIAEYVGACRKGGIKVGFYFSGPDWRFSHSSVGVDPKSRQLNEFKRCVHTQIRELCTNYGKIDVWWWDGGPPETGKVIRWMRKVQPEMVINDRCGIGTWQQKLDCASCEGEIKPPSDPKHMWEACKTSNKHWGYYGPGDISWMSVTEAIHWLVTIASHSGNFLLNIGPKANGDIPPKARRLFEAIGRWLAVNGESIYACKRSHLQGDEGCALTAKGKTAYLHILHYYHPEIIVLSPKAKIKTARILATGRKLTVRASGPRVTISGLPSKAPDKHDTVIELKTSACAEA